VTNKPKMESHSTHSDGQWQRQPKI